MLQLYKLVVLSFIFWSWRWTFYAAADPQILLVNHGCSQYNATNFSNFFSNLNATFLDLKTQVSNQSKHFATAQSTRGSDPVYAMFQCRNYLSTADCASCFATATAQIGNCSSANGARDVYDGCFLRYNLRSMASGPVFNNKLLMMFYYS